MMLAPARRIPIRSLVLAGSISVVTAVADCGSGDGERGSAFGGADGGEAGASRDAMSSGSSSGVVFGSSGGASSSGGGASSGGVADSAATTTDANFPCDGCAPFPPQGASPCPATTLDAPTLVYPLDGVLLPPNMNVLEVQWVPPPGATLFEVDFTNSVTNVRVETACNQITSVRGAANVGCGLTLSQTQWNDIANTNRDGAPVTVTVRATAPSLSCVSASAQSVNISFAKEDLSGGIYYWQSATYGGIAGTTGGIYYHDFGTFNPTPTPFWTSGATGLCIGCHTLSRDGARMSLMNDDPDADDEYGDVKTLTMDVASRTVLGGKNVGPGFQTFTHDHALMVASTFHAMGMPMPMMGMPPPPMGKPDAQFAVWTGDGNTMLALDPLPMNSGLQLYGTQPNLSYDDATLVFVAPGYSAMNQTTISQAGDHHFLGGSLWSATFSAAAPYGLTNFSEILPATGQQNFYYPDQSPLVSGAGWLVFNENDDNSAANNDGDCFYSRKARVKIMHVPPQAGDVPLDLSALNVADGLSNSWPRWSPAVQTYKGHRILWVTFSSNRDYGLHLKNTTNGFPAGGATFDNYYPPESPAYDQPQPASKQGITFNAYAAPQIWMAAIVVDPDRTLDASDRSYPAFWLPFQDVTAHNHSAQWVATVQSGGGGSPPGGDAGTGTGGDSGMASDSGGGTCNEQGGTCGPSGGTCCADVVCCAGSYLCQGGCIQ
jgi:hypothetical protein